MKKIELEKQIELLKKYNITNYTIDNYQLTINGSLDLDSLTSCDKDFLKDTTINGSLDLRSLTSCDKDFLKDTTINGYLDLDSLTSCDKDFLKDTTINGYLDLKSLTSCDKDFLKDTTINGSLYLDSLTSCDKDFLKDTTINGSLDLRSLTSCDKDFLKDTTINGSLDLRSLTSCDKDFLKDTTINGYLYLRSLTSCDKIILISNVKQLEVGYNKKRSNCYFDGILSKVISTKKTKGYIIYETPFEFIAQKEDFTAHGESIKKAIQDLEFKIVADKLKSEPIYKDTIIDINHYRLITGACESGVKQWIKNNEIELESIRADELLPLLEETNAYGLSKFKELIKF